MAATEASPLTITVVYVVNYSEAHCNNAAPMIDTIFALPCNFKIAFIRWALMTLTCDCMSISYKYTLTLLTYLLLKLIVGRD